MTADHLVFPDFSDHPPPPQLTHEQFSHWIFNEWLPMCAARGEMTEEKLLADFMNNEGRVTSWPDFGAGSELKP